MVSKDPSRGMARSHRHKHNDKDNEKNHVQNSGQKFDPGNQPEGVHVHQPFDDQHGKNDECKMPSLRLIVREVQIH